MRPSYKLSKSNIILSSIFCVLLLIIAIRLLGFSYYTLGVSLGVIITTFIIPLIISFLVWLLFPAKNKSQSVVFNIIAILFFWGSFVEIAKIKNEKTVLFKNILIAKEQLVIDTKKQPDSTQLNYSKFSKTIKKNIKQIVEMSGGSEKKVFVAVENYFNEFNMIYPKWDNSYEKVLNDTILNFKLLKETKECDRQINIVENYILNSKEYKNFIVTRKDFLKKKGIENDIKDSFIKAFLKELKTKDSIQLPLLKKHLNAHIKYGENIINIIQILKDSNHKWDYNDDILLFDEDKTMNNYNKVIEELTKNEEIINSSHSEITEIM